MTETPSGPHDEQPEDVPEQGAGPADQAGPGPAEGTGAGAPAEVDPLQAAHDEVTLLRHELAERTTDLQRLQAEFLNYKRRVERDRELVRENATYAALAPIVEVLDTIDRAREHGEVEGGFKAVADQLERIVSAVGLTKYGEPGDPFDPTRHEALSHLGTDPEVEVTTVKVLAKAGYRIGERVVRAAQVLVVDPAEATGGAGETEPTQPTQPTQPTGAGDTE